MKDRKALYSVMWEQIYWLLTLKPRCWHSGRRHSATLLCEPRQLKGHVQGPSPFNSRPHGYDRLLLIKSAWLCCFCLLLVLLVCILVTKSVETCSWFAGLVQAVCALAHGNDELLT